MITKIEVSRLDIERLENELEESKAIGLSPLIIKFNLCPELIMLERQYAINLIAMFHLNANIPTYLEVDVSQESILSMHE